MDGEIKERSTFCIKKYINNIRAGNLSIAEELIN